MDAIHDDVAEFALLLTRMKERTGRSYAALAHRLGVNASTLHRYCAGEAVPLDFTGIERFAALCGASAEERVELHRRWILAVAARKRPRRSAARRAPAPRDTTSTAAAAASVSHNSPADETPEPTSPTSPTEPTSPTDSRPEPTSSAGMRPEPVSPADRRPRAGRPRRRSVRSMALAAALAFALAGLAASAAGPSSGGGESSASARTTPQPSAPATPSGNRQSAAGPPSGGGESSASAHTTPQPSAPATPSGSPQENRSSAGPVPPPVPLTWTANSHLWRPECDHDYVIAKPPRQVPPPPAPQDAAAWATSLGAVHGRTTHLRISVQGRGSAAVILEALHVRVVSRTTPAAGRGIAYSMYEGCGAILIPRHFSVNLDAHRPLARSIPGNDPDRPDPAVDFPYQVSLREPEVLLLSARTDSCTCDWYVELDWSSQGRTGTVRIDDHGRPFRTTTIEGLPHYWYRNPSGWVPMTTSDDTTETGD
ncbi:helix-turn-helix domain-containing protein [Streptomyces echinatus]|uniref:helix-turn-helix domain-containing protein n=1 Tax=Streptomyces echinatus TaxID=67293 RepID=UPI0037A1B40D